MKNQSQEIHDMINGFPLEDSPELTTSRLLDILTALNNRMDSLEKSINCTHNIASCLANGIKPD